MAKLQNKYKIALVGYRLCGGGSEKVMINLSKYLEKIGVEVHIITVLDEGDTSYGGNYFSTAQFKKGNGIFGRWNRFRHLTSFFRKNKFDYIIDFRFRTKPIQELLLSKYVYNSPTIYTVHSWAIEHYIPQKKWWAQCIYAKSKAIVCVSKSIERRIKEKYKFEHLHTIYNSYLSEEFTEENTQQDSKTILFVGQLENKIKQLDHLFYAFEKSKLYKKGYVIKICGTGALEAEYKELARQLSIDQNVFFLGFVQPPYKEMYKASCMVLCSAFEGFANVMIEALYCHLPVISYDLQSGPSEIIEDKINGLLVKNQDITKLSEALLTFFSNEKLRKTCRENARKSVEKFEINQIGKQWVKLLQLK